VEAGGDGTIGAELGSKSSCVLRQAGKVPHHSPENKGSAHFPVLVKAELSLKVFEIRIPLHSCKLLRTWESFVCMRE
jgi:hypothetical protein